jgi:hypothetical protein
MTAAGESEVSVGTGFVLTTWRIKTFDEPPPGAGLATAMESGPTLARKLAGRATVSEVALPEAGVRAVVFTCTVAPFTKLVPVTTRLNPALPTRTLVCEREVRTGTGFSTARERALEVPPPGAGFVTVIESDPAAARRFAGIVTVSEVAVTEDGARLVAFT